MIHPHLTRCIGRAAGWKDRVAGWTPRCMVLYYHLIPEPMVDHFLEQLAMLQKMTTLVTAHAGSDLLDGGPCAALTIDDCFASAVERATPLLRERQIPVTLFVPSSRIGRPPDWNPRGEFDAKAEWIVSKSMLRSLSADPLVTIGSHGSHHVDFTALDERSVRSELVDSKHQLEAITGRTVHSFSFPFGRATLRHVELAREAGYTHVFGTDPTPHHGTTHGLIGRVRVDPWDSPGDFMLKVRGAYRWLPRARAIKRRLTYGHILQDRAYA